MVSRWFKLNDRKKETLAQILRGSILFALLFIITKNSDVIICPSRIFFHRKCLGCGMTSGFCKMLDFDIKGAAECNALAPILFFGCVTYCTLAFADLFTEKNLVEKFEKILRSKKILPFYALCLIWALTNY